MSSSFLNQEDRKEVTAYVDEVSNKPLLAKEPAGSKVVSEKKDTAIMTTTLTFANGVKAILKPTTFKNDQILIEGYHFGGTSLVSDADFTSANLASEVVGNSGLADFKETQLARMHPGQKAELEVDAYPGMKLHGHVESIQQGAGARFSLLPPENATGNYVKVVQRIPVKIVFEPGETKTHDLRPGMSVTPKVWIR